MELALRQRANTTGVLLLLCAVTMLFTSLTSALLVRRGLAADWIALNPPQLLWWNSLSLAASSVALELKHRRTALILGILFLTGQVVLWTDLWRAGIFASSNPGAAFFYVFTGAHALHAGGGIAALAGAAGPAGRIYWHFLTGLWIYVLLLIRVYMMSQG